MVQPMTGKLHVVNALDVLHAVYGDLGDGGGLLLRVAAAPRHGCCALRQRAVVAAKWASAWPSAQPRSRAPGASLRLARIKPPPARGS